MTVFQLILLVSLTSPQKGDALVSGPQFPTEVLCNDHIERLKPGVDNLLQSLFGKDMHYTKIEYKCAPFIITDGQPV